jgi:hypothetical protein
MKIEACPSSANENGLPLFANETCNEAISLSSTNDSRSTGVWRIHSMAGPGLDCPSRAAITRVIGEAELAGRDGIAAARAAFSGGPKSVLWDARAVWDERQTEAWWNSIEQTIQGDAICNTIAEASPPLVPRQTATHEIDLEDIPF